MSVFETDLELLQFTADTRFGGDVEALAVALDNLEAGLQKNRHYYRKVGNNCIVWSYRPNIMQICEENPDKLQGVFVADYDPIIQRGAVIIGSLLVGNSEVIRGSVVRGSNLVGSSYITRSTITESRIAGGEFCDSVIDRSFVHARVINSNIQSCLGVVGSIRSEAKINTLLNLKPEDDIEYDFNPAQKLLAENGINPIPASQMIIPPPIQV